MYACGVVIAQLHGKANLIHGDLTTSNLLLPIQEIQEEKKEEEEEEESMGMILIDFGLSQSSASVEDRAVDIYVFERAIQSTHPQDQGEWMFDAIVMKGYTGGRGDS